MICEVAKAEIEQMNQGKTMKSIPRESASSNVSPYLLLCANHKTRVLMVPKDWPSKSYFPSSNLPFPSSLHLSSLWRFSRLYSLPHKDLQDSAGAGVVRETVRTKKIGYWAKDKILSWCFQVVKPQHDIYGSHIKFHLTSNFILRGMTEGEVI